MNWDIVVLALVIGAWVAMGVAIYYAVKTVRLTRGSRRR